MGVQTMPDSHRFPNPLREALKYVYGVCRGLLQHAQDWQRAYNDPNYLYVDTQHADRVESTARHLEQFAADRDSNEATFLCDGAAELRRIWGELCEQQETLGGLIADELDIRDGLEDTGHIAGAWRASISELHNLAGELAESEEVAAADGWEPPVSPTAPADTPDEPAAPGGNVEPPGQPRGGEPTVRPQPVVERSHDGDAITYNGTRHPVGEGWGAAFEAMLNAKGQPVGLSKYLSKPCRALGKLPPDLRSIISKGHGNCGYYLNTYSPPDSA